MINWLKRLFSRRKNVAPKTYKWEIPITRAMIDDPDIEKYLPPKNIIQEDLERAQLEFMKKKYNLS